MRSMTGYGRAECRADGWEVVTELRAVNHRFLDVACRVPRELCWLEDTVRGELKALMRGHVEAMVSLTRGEEASRQVQVDWPLAQAYVDAARELCRQTQVRDDLAVAQLMSLPGVVTVTEQDVDEEAVKALCREALRTAVRQLDEMRLREGERLQADLTLHLENAEKLRQRISDRASGVVEDYRARLTERLARLPVEPVDPARLAQEVALMADRCAIDEELSRLESHVGQFRQYLLAEGECGKKLDFLLQEMNREANTIGSKCNDASIAQWVVDLKSELEKLREQVQNVV